MDTHQQTPPSGGDALIAGDVETSTDERRDNTPELDFRSRRAEMLRGTMESRQFPLESMECRQLDDGTIRMGGYASVTEHFYEVGDPERGGFRERISRQAFKRSLSESPDVVLLVNHEGLPLARTKNGSLSLQEDARGLHWTADLDPEDPGSTSLQRKVESGLLDQCSFAFQATSDTWDADYTERTIKSVSLHRGDVSVVTHGANPATSVTTLRSDDGTVELRAGKVLSSANEAALRGVLDRIAAADEQLDLAQPELATVLDVANPDADDTADSERSAPTVPAPVPIPDYTTRARERLAQLRRAA